MSQTPWICRKCGIGNHSHEKRCFKCNSKRQLIELTVIKDTFTCLSKGEKPKELSLLFKRTLKVFN
jgi:predicted ATP-dependent serine protease